MCAARLKTNPAIGYWLYPNGTMVKYYRKKKKKEKKKEE